MNTKRTMWIGKPYDGEIFDVPAGAESLQYGDLLAAIVRISPASTDADQRIGRGLFVREVTKLAREGEETEVMLRRLREAGCVE